MKPSTKQEVARNPVELFCRLFKPTQLNTSFCRNHFCRTGTNCARASSQPFKNERSPLPQSRRPRRRHACRFGHGDNARNSAPLLANFFNELWMALIAKPLYSLIPPCMPSAKPVVMTSIVIAGRECRPTRSIVRLGPAHSAIAISRVWRRS